MTVIIPGRPQRPVTVQPGRDLPPGGTAGQALIKSSDSDFATTWGTATSSAAWGAITGTLASQTDLQSALDAKQVALVSGANIKTVNGSNILGAGDLVVSSSIADGDKGDITVSGSGATWTIAAGAVTVSKMANLAASTILGNNTGVSAAPIALSVAQVKALLAIAAGDVSGLAAVATSGSASDLSTGTIADARLPAFGSGDVSFASGGGAGTIANNAVTNAKAADMATGTIKGRSTAGTGDPEDLTGTQATALLDAFTSGAKGLVPASGGGTTNFLRADGSWAAPPGGGTQPQSIIVAVGDETTTLTTGTGKVTFRMPYAFTLTGIRASVKTAQASGSILTVDVNEEGTSILATKLTIDNGEKSSTTAATAAVMSDTSLADDAEITIDIDQVGTGGVGLKVALIGYPT